MMDQRRFCDPVADNHLNHFGCRHGLAKHMPHDLAREGVCHQGQIMHTFIAIDIGNIADKHLLRAAGFTSCQKVGMLSYPVVDVVGLGTVLS